MRGKREVGNGWKIQSGITPACAGKTKWLDKNISNIRDHPRMCGENFFIAFVHTVIPGSPPHVRGKQIERTNVDAAMGITPACAGKTEIEMINAFRLLGSPPHVRGKQIKTI